jgi:hypothetical protein
MSTYRSLADQDHRSRRTAMDALEVLRREASFGDDDSATAYVGLLRLPSNDKVGLISIRYAEGKTVSCVSLPASTHFNAVPDNLSFPCRFNVELLDQAQIDSSGRIRLRDGRHLRALEIESAFLPTDPTELDWTIVHLTLQLVDAKDCYRGLRESFSPEECHLVPDLHFLDMARLSELRLPPLKEITNFVAARYKKVSAQQVANALRKFGIRHPQARSC